MSLDQLVERLEFLKIKLQEANEGVNELTSKLQQATVNLHTVHGHFNEINYLIANEKNRLTDLTGVDNGCVDNEGA